MKIRKNVPVALIKKLVRDDVKKYIKRNVTLDEAALIDECCGIIAQTLIQINSKEV